nr:A_TM021B04.11 protein [Ipomoea batatas]
MSATCYGGFRHHPRLGLCNSRIMCLSESGGGERWQVLKRVDEELSKGDERAALSLVKDLQGKPGGLRCFGAARQIPQRLYSLEELRLNGIETVSLLSPVDATLGSIERNLQIAALSGGVAAWNVLNLNPQQILFISLGLLFLLTFDSVSFNGGFGALILDTIGHTLSEKYHNRVIQHEAGHFLIAYLLGILPRGYTLTSLEALKKEGSLNVQAGTAFVDFEFLEEVASCTAYCSRLYLNCVHPIGVYCKIFRIVFYVFRGCWTWVFGPPPNNPLSHLVLDLALHWPLPNNFTLGSGSTILPCFFVMCCLRTLLNESSVNKGQVSATMLNRFSCIALAGVATEYLLFGCAEGGLTDINQKPMQYYYHQMGGHHAMCGVLLALAMDTTITTRFQVRLLVGAGYWFSWFESVNYGQPRFSRISKNELSVIPKWVTKWVEHDFCDLLLMCGLRAITQERGLPSAHLRAVVVVGLSTAKPGVYTEKGRFSGEMGCTEHYTHSAPPRECPSKACRGNV